MCRDTDAAANADVGAGAVVGAAIVVSDGKAMTLMVVFIRGMMLVRMLARIRLPTPM